uniref:Similar to haloacid dehalogenase-like hydrolase family protein n=1 Tax=Arundo donax TaxID=35708 RepID=A0A0A9CEY7_ARUDO
MGLSFIMRYWTLWNSLLIAKGCLLSLRKARLGRSSFYLKVLMKQFSLVLIQDNKYGAILRQ